MHNQLVVRYDPSSQKGSVLDVIRLCNGSRSNHAAALLGMLCEKRPDWKIERNRIRGKGRLTPVADKDTLVEIMQACPPLRNGIPQPQQLQLVQTLIDKAFTLTSNGSKRKNRTTMKRKITGAKPFGPLSAMIRLSKIHKC